MKTMNITLKAEAVNLRLKRTLLTTVMIGFSSLPLAVLAQAHTGHADHAFQPAHAPTAASHDSGVRHPSSGDSGSDDSMGLSGRGHGSGSVTGGADINAMNHDAGKMDHGNMKMQGGSAPPDARDPDAYSGGYVRNAGKYALAPSDALMMSDTHRFGSVKFDRFEYVAARGKEWGAYEGDAWYGSTYNRVALKAEGEMASGTLKESQTELLWRHAISAYWDTELGVRFDYAIGEPNREWVAFGIRGTAPYWFEVDATAYVGSSGRTALGFSAEYDILLTQKLYLQPAVEVTFYGKDDKERGTGSGLTHATAGMRLKYEITRQLVPYIGVEWSRKFGKTADYARAAGESRHETRFVAGLSFRF